MKANIYSIDGRKTGSVELPDAFNEEYRPDLIHRAFLAETSRNYQAKGSDPRAGLRSAAESWGVGGGRSRVPRIKAGPRRGGREARGHTYRSKGRWFARAAQGAVMPGTKGGRQAHPPKAEEIIVKKINKKEYKKAMRAAIAATSKKEVVEGRGHRIGNVKEFPIIVEDKLLSLKKTKEIFDAFKKLGLDQDIERAKPKKIRAGKGKGRGRKFRKKKGPLIIIPKEGFEFTASNLAGVEVLKSNHLNVKSLAPGAVPGRLTMWTKKSLEEVIY